MVKSYFILTTAKLVNWELHQPRNCEPKGYKGARTAKQVLDNSDPRYRYWKVDNVQSSNARISSGNKVASYDIFSQVLMPLTPEEKQCSYSWLLEGSEHDVRKIHGLTGLSSKLLHIYAKITHMTAQLKDVGLPYATLSPCSGSSCSCLIQECRSLGLSYVLLEQRSLHSVWMGFGSGLNCRRDLDDSRSYSRLASLAIMARSARLRRSQN